MLNFVGFLLQLGMSHIVPLFYFGLKICWAAVKRRTVMIFGRLWLNKNDKVWKNRNSSVSTVLNSAG